MTLTALGLVLTASLAHALWNAAAKTVHGHGYTFVFAYQLLSAVIMLPIGITILVQQPELIGWPLLGVAAVSGLLHIAYSVTLQTGYARADLGVVYPVARGTGPVLTMLIALAMLGERPGWPGILGGLIIVTGIAVVTVPGRPAAGVPDRRDSSRPLVTGLFWGGLTGALIAGYTLWDHHVVTTTAYPPLLYFALSSAFNAVVMAPRAVCRPADLRAVAVSDKRAVAVVSVLSPLAYILVLIAMQQAPVSLVAPLRETSIIIGMLLAWWLFHERDLGRRLTGAAIVITGIGLIALA
ncbi:DMT family transporter [Brevibacterium luteolum]|uniref:DMT family transporter n=1 Tax=Brevibacterium luteolum TaxID=199591 RepID=UPI003B67DFC7